MDQLAAILRRQRHLLELLLFKLIEARHLLAAGEVRFLAWAAQEVEKAVTKVREAELERALAVSRIADELGVPVDSLSLKALADDCPEPYRTIFEDHRSAFLELVGEIETVTAANRKLAGQGIKGVQEVLDMIGRGDSPADDVRLYGPDATTRRATAAGATRFDGAL